MIKCKLCKKQEATWAWQPFGPTNVMAFTLLGFHYRGFPAIKVCADCKNGLQDASINKFTYKGESYVIEMGSVWVRGKDE